MAEKSLSIAIKGRDESAAAFASVDKRISGITGASIAKLAGGFFAVSSVAKLAAAGVMGLVGALDQVSAAGRQNVGEMLEAQIKLNTAYGEMAGSVPMIGESLKKAVDAWNNPDGLRRLISYIKETDNEVKSLVTNTAKLAENADIMAMQNRGDRKSVV